MKIRVWYNNGDADIIEGDLFILSKNRISTINEIYGDTIISDYDFDNIDSIDIKNWWNNDKI